jgi:hypothetical protein
MGSLQPFRLPRSFFGVALRAATARWAGRVFDTIVHRDEQIEAYVERGMPITVSGQTTPGADLYARLADEALARLRVTHA